jgi:hypothetical protein
LVQRLRSGWLVVPTFVAVLLTSGIALGEPAAGPDACRSIIPDEMIAPLAKRFPGFRLPRMSDLADDNISIDRGGGGNGCAAAKRVGMVGKDLPAVAIVLVGENQPKLQLVAGLHRHDHWELYPLPTWCVDIATCYVEGREGGIYTRTAALSGAISDPDERETLDSPYGVIVSGKIESTGVVYALDHGHWHYVWVSD